MRGRRSRRAIVLLWLALAGLAPHALVGSAHRGARGAGDSLVFEICGDVGAGPDEAASPELLGSEAPDHANEMRCRDLCGVRGIAMIDARRCCLRFSWSRRTHRRQTMPPREPVPP